MVSTRQRVLPEEGVNYQFSFTLGVLGTDVAQETQDFIHEALDEQVPRGWDNQISEGGEPTFRYALARHKTLAVESSPDGAGFDVRSAVSASFGYVAEVTAGITARRGIIPPPWWSFTPDYTEYINLGPCGAGW